jgi:hypothetical protein
VLLDRLRVREEHSVIEASMSHTHLRHFSESSATGITLLEVLVACGILLLGLASVAALLPAATFQLSQATTEDRAGTLSHNAGGEARIRRLSAADVCSDPRRATGFGFGLGELATVAPAYFAGTTPAYASRIDPTRGFVLEDDLVFMPNAQGFPSNTLFNGMSGPREFREKVCWGAVLLPGMNADGTGVAETRQGGPVTLAVASLRKAPDPGTAVKRFTLHASATAYPGSPNKFLPPSGTCVMSSQNGSEVDRKRFLGACSWVMLLPKDPGAWPIRLIQVNSSWAQGGSSHLVLRIPEDLLELDTNGNPVFDRYRPSPSGGRQEVSVIGIANLVRLDQYQLTLD